MSNELNQSIIMQALNWAYDKAVDGGPRLDSAKEMAENYNSIDGDLTDKANSLIKWQVAKAGTSGFLTGLGGGLTMPATIPANIASVTFVQIRMIAAIAYMGGYNLNDDRVKSLVYICMAGNSAKDVVKEIGIAVGKKLTANAIKNISGKAITKINQKVGFRLLTKFGEKGAINLGKLVPIIGGIIGGGFDSGSTKLIGNIARDTFIPNDAQPPLHTDS